MTAKSEASYARLKCCFSIKRERERERGRMGGREGERQRERDRERQRERGRETERDRDRERQREIVKLSSFLYWKSPDFLLLFEAEITFSL